MAAFHYVVFHSDSNYTKIPYAKHLMVLDKANIEARPVWKPMHCQPCYRKGDVKSEMLKVKGQDAECITYDNSVAYVNGVSESLFKVGMCLPAGPYVSDDDVKYIVETIKAAIERV